MATEPQLDPPQEHKLISGGYPWDGSPRRGTDTGAASCPYAWSATGMRGSSEGPDGATLLLRHILGLAEHLYFTEHFPEWRSG